jgi:MFS family permease
MFFVSVTVLGVAGPFLAWAPSGWWAFVAAVPLGVGGAGFLANFNGLVQQKCPPDMRGRLLALSAVAFLGSTPIGGPITGVIADSWGPEWSLAYGSLISLMAIGVAYAALRLPARNGAVATK